MTKIINLFAGPGAGKSTLAAGLFYELKIRGYNAELAPEYAKEVVWENRSELLLNQPYLFGKQYHRICRLLGKVDVVITDSPILLCCLYAGNNYPSSFRFCVGDIHETLDNINYFIKREKSYNPKGRNQTESEAKQIDSDVYQLLTEYLIEFKEIPGTAEGLRLLVDDVQKRLKNEIR